MTEGFGATRLSSDAELISAARSGDDEAFGLLYERHAGAARRLARQIVSRADVDDVVAETFTKVLGAIRRGAGPSEAFRPYLLTAVRRVGSDQLRSRRDLVLIEDADLVGAPYFADDPALASLERSVVARAFRSLPERWSAVLWHTEVEQARPSEIAMLLGITPNGVAALSRRAREGLRQAYLQMHVSAQTTAECSAAAGKLGSYVRGRLSSGDARMVGSHLRSCGSCTAACAELTALNGSLRGIIGPVVLGSEAARYLAHVGHAVSGGTTALCTLRRLVWPRPVLPVAAGVALTAGLLPSAILGHLTSPHAVNHAATVSPHAALSPAAGGGRRTAPPTTSARHHRVRRPPASPGPLPDPQPAKLPPAHSRSPAGTPTSTPDRHAARLGIVVSVTGPLVPGHVAVVTVRVSDPGTAATTALTSELSVPPGTDVLGLAGSSAGWTCTSGSSGAESCTRAALAAGAESWVAFRLSVVSLAGCGSHIADTVTSAALSVTGISARTIRPCGGGQADLLVSPRPRDGAA